MFFLPSDRQRARDIQQTVGIILTKLKSMPTDADLQAKLNDLEAAVVAAVETETTELAALLAAQPGISQATLDRVDAMRANIAAKIAGIVNPPEPPPQA